MSGEEFVVDLYSQGVAFVKEIIKQRELILRYKCSYGVASETMRALGGLHFCDTSVVAVVKAS